MIESTAVWPSWQDRQVSDAMPFLIGLSPDQRLRLARVGDRTRPFVQDALSVAFANTGLLPRSVDIEQLRARAESLTQLGEVKRQLQSLLEKVSDSEIRLASDLYGVTRTVYTVLKTPATVPGAPTAVSAVAATLEEKARFGVTLGAKLSTFPMERRPTTPNTAKLVVVAKLGMVMVVLKNIVLWLLFSRKIFNASRNELTCLDCSGFFA